MVRRRLDSETAKRLQTFLRGRHAELTEEIRAAKEAAARSGERGSADPSDRAVAAFQHEIDALRLHRVARQLVALEAALDRLTRKEYGVCDDCGEFVGLARLKALPFTRRCRACQRHAEATSGLPSPPERIAASPRAD
jgi:DnaK suppressor protein